MADALLDKSLDQLIKDREEKKSAKPRSSGIKVRTGAGGKPLGGGARKGGAAGTSSAAPKQLRKSGIKQQRAPLLVQSGKVSKPRGGARSGLRGKLSAMPMQASIPPGWTMMPVPPGWPAIVPPFGLPGAAPAGRAAVSRQAPTHVHQRRDPDAGKWVHDMCDTAPVRRQPPQQRLQRPLPTAISNGTKLIVRNLADKVTEQDIEELFSTKGELISHKLHSGGSATVVFRYKEDAEQAIEEYNKLLLDGLKLDIAVAPEKEFLRLSSGLRVMTEGDGSSSVRPTGRGSVGAGRLLQQALEPSAQARTQLPSQARSQAPTMPRGMGDAPSSYEGLGNGRGRGPGPRVRSGVSRAAAAEDSMLE